MCLTTRKSSLFEDILDLFLTTYQQNLKKEPRLLHMSKTERVTVLGISCQPGNEANGEATPLQRKKKGGRGMKVHFAFYPSALGTMFNPSCLETGSKCFHFIFSDFLKRNTCSQLGERFCLHTNEPIAQCWQTFTKFRSTYVHFDRRQRILNRPPGAGRVGCHSLQTAFPNSWQQQAN